MRGWRAVLATVSALAAVQAPAPTMAQPAKRGAPAGFAEPGDIIAAEGNFAHFSAAKGLKYAIRATAVPDAQIFAPQLLRVGVYANTADPSLGANWHTRQVWMSCDGSVAVTHGEWQRPPAKRWYVTVWHRQKDGSYKWLLAQDGAVQTPAPQAAMAEADRPALDMIAASVADCPLHRARSAAAQSSTAAPGKAAIPDYQSGHADDATLEWTTTIAADAGRSFVLRLKQDGAWHEVLRAIAAPPGA